MAILSHFSEHDVRFLGARTQQLALAGHNRSVRSSRALGVVVVVAPSGWSGENSPEWISIVWPRLSAWFYLPQVLLVRFRHLATVRHHGFDDDAVSFQRFSSWHGTCLSICEG